MNTLTKESYNVCLEDFKNRVDHLLNVTSNISEKFDNKYLIMCDEIIYNCKKIKKMMRKKNFDKKVGMSKTLKILTSVHGLRELDYDGYIVHGTAINWGMWDKYFDIIKKVHPNIEWSKYSDLDIIDIINRYYRYNRDNIDIYMSNQDYLSLE